MNEFKIAKNAKMSKKKKIIIISAITLVFCACVAAVTVFFASAHRDAANEQQYIESTLQNIDDLHNAFNISNSRVYKITLFNGLTDLQSEFLTGGYEHEEIESRYSTALNNMQVWFRDEHNSAIVEISSIEQIAIDDIETLLIKIERLQGIRAAIDVENLFEIYPESLSYLNIKIDALLENYIEIKDWHEKINEINNRFDSADRNGKYTVYKEAVSTQVEYTESSFNHEDVTVRFDNSIDDMKLWFFDWYTDIIEELSVYTIEEPDEDEDINNDDAEVEDTNDPDKNEPWDYLIDAIIELNNLVVLFDSEHEAIFTSPDYFYGEFDNALHGNLNTLEEVGVGVINGRNFRNRASELAIEKYMELFEDWKEDYKDNDHLLTYSELLQDALNTGSDEHDKIVAAEAAERARQQQNRNSGGGSRGGSSSGGGGNNHGGGSSGSGASGGSGGGSGNNSGGGGGQLPSGGTGNFADLQRELDQLVVDKILQDLLPGNP